MLYMFNNHSTTTIVSHVVFYIKFQPQKFVSHVHYLCFSYVFYTCMFNKKNLTTKIHPTCSFVFYMLRTKSDHQDSTHMFICVSYVLYIFNKNSTTKIRLTCLCSFCMCSTCLIKNSIRKDSFHMFIICFSYVF